MVLFIYYDYDDKCKQNDKKIFPITIISCLDSDDIFQEFSFGFEQCLSCLTYHYEITRLWQDFLDLSTIRFDLTTKKKTNKNNHIVFHCPFYSFFVYVFLFCRLFFVSYTLTNIPVITRLLKWTYVFRNKDEN